MSQLLNTLATLAVIFLLTVAVPVAGWLLLGGALLGLDTLTAHYLGLDSGFALFSWAFGLLLFLSFMFGGSSGP